MRPGALEKKSAALFDLPCACQNLRRVTRAVTRIYDEELRKAGLGVTQFGLLTALAATEEANQKRLSAGFENSGERGRTRTCDPCLKRALLYQLSYAPTFNQSNTPQKDATFPMPTLSDGPMPGERSVTLPILARTLVGRDLTTSERTLVDPLQAVIFTNCPSGVCPAASIIAFDSGAVVAAEPMLRKAPDDSLSRKWVYHIRTYLIRKSFLSCGSRCSRTLSKPTTHNIAKSRIGSIHRTVFNIAGRSQESL